MQAAHVQTHKIGYWVNILLLVVGVIIMLYPLAWLISTAFKPEASAFNGQLIPSNPTIANFSQILTPSSTANIPRWLFNSLVVSVVASLLVVLVDSLAAYALARLHFFGSKFLIYLVIASLVVPFIVLLIPLYLEFAQLNLIDSYLALILPYSANGFGVFLLYQFFRSIPKDLEEAAIIDGASKFQVWRRIFLPLSIPATATLALLMALTLFSVIPMVLAFLFAQKQLVQGVATSGMKE